MCYLAWGSPESSLFFSDFWIKLLLSHSCLFSCQLWVSSPRRLAYHLHLSAALWSRDVWWASSVWRSRGWCSLNPCDIFRLKYYWLYQFDPWPWWCSFSRGHVPGSINVPYSCVFGPEGEVLQCPSTSTLASYRSRVVVILSNITKNAAGVSPAPVFLFCLHVNLSKPPPPLPVVCLFECTHWCCTCSLQFAAHLVKVNFPRVCVLDGGINKMKPTGLLTVPSPQI